MAIFVVGAGIPVVLTWLGYVSYVPAVLDKIKPYLVYPSAIGTYQVPPLPYLLGNAPTVGQSLYIAVFVVLNVVLTAVDDQSRQPNAWFACQWNEIMAYVSHCTGNYAFMMAPLVALFSSRNNILLWLSNRSYATYLLLHRRVARIFTLYAILHSILGLMIYSEYQTTQWWIWGAVATVAAVVLAVGIGITGPLPWALNHWNVRLAWSVKESAKCLVEAVDGVLGGIADKSIRVGDRLNVTELIAEEANAGWGRVGVVVSGPGELCDQVRAAVAAAGRRGKTVFELEVDAYSW